MVSHAKPRGTRMETVCVNQRAATPVGPYAHTRPIRTRAYRAIGAPPIASAAARSARRVPPHPALKTLSPKSATIDRLVRRHARTIASVLRTPSATPIPMCAHGPTIRSPEQMATGAPRTASATAASAARVARGNVSATTLWFLVRRAPTCANATLDARVQPAPEAASTRPTLQRVRIALSTANAQVTAVLGSTAWRSTGRAPTQLDIVLCATRTSIASIRTFANRTFPTLAEGVSKGLPRMPERRARRTAIANPGTVPTGPTRVRTPTARALARRMAAQTSSVVAGLKVPRIALLTTAPRVMGASTGLASFRREPWGHLRVAHASKAHFAPAVRIRVPATSRARAQPTTVAPSLPANPTNACSPTALPLAALHAKATRNAPVMNVPIGGEPSNAVSVALYTAIRANTM